jgi:hypothetical protein
MAPADAAASPNERVPLFRAPFRRRAPAGNPRSGSGRFPLSGLLPNRGRTGGGGSRFSPRAVAIQGVAFDRRASVPPAGSCPPPNCFPLPPYRFASREGPLPFARSRRQCRPESLYSRGSPTLNHAREGPPPYGRWGTPPPVSPAHSPPTDATSPRVSRSWAKENSVVGVITSRVARWSRGRRKMSPIAS